MCHFDLRGARRGHGRVPSEDGAVDQDEGQLRCSKAHGGAHGTY